MKRFVKPFSMLLVVALCVVALAACGPDTEPEKAKAALKKEGYDVDLVTNETSVNRYASALGIQGLVAYIDADRETGEIEDDIHILYFTDSDTAKNAYESTTLSAAAALERDEDNLTWVYELSGNMVYYGTETAVKNAN